MSDTYLGYVWMPNGDMLIYGTYKGREFEKRINEYEQKLAGVRFLDQEVQQRLEKAIKMLEDDND